MDNITFKNIQRSDMQKIKIIMFLPALLVCSYIIGAEPKSGAQKPARHLKPKSKNDSSHSDETIIFIENRKVMEFPPSPIRKSGSHKVSTQENNQKK
jgi:hypothetical protein